MPPISDTDVDIPMQYWMSEHHRFEMGEFADRLCQQNPLSYHQMGLAVPGTFVDEGRLIEAHVTEDFSYENNILCSGSWLSDHYKRLHLSW